MTLAATLARRIVFGVAALAALTLSVSAAPIAGTRIRVIDGDTIAIGTERIRLKDIDAPEITHPRCDAERVRGLAAKARLIDLLRGRVDVERHSRDRYGRTLARVTVAGRSVGAVLMAEGLAVAWHPGRQAWEERFAHWCGEGVRHG